MSRTGWKNFERVVAAKLGGKRYPANTGGGVDVAAPGIIVQCKERKVLPFKQLEELVLAIETEAQNHPEPVIGLVVARRSAGSGKHTIPLVVLSLEEWCQLDVKLKQKGDSA